jgi:hypothetical protein
MQTIEILNITDKDTEKKIIRITSENKYLFPEEIKGEPRTYTLNFKYNETEFLAKYTIGSKDGKSRSGILRLGREIYDDILNIIEGTRLKISKESERTYLICKV